ncbi:TonB-dependent receptor [Burkholderia sp. Ac-20392]|uniref:TonB-dependent receptor domain-containing protein n=1 Tax=Burkholderia sp. Ac-20392 TaxID=2703905 RepID=UPI00197F3303|nr:TonB-dependent receptor [Burkholderia sp. Ac-20392]MBN3798855.1 TonB-dependent receptor [Burkholderia sp. Ac-20392]
MQNTSLYIKRGSAIALCLSGLATTWMPAAAQEAASSTAAVGAPPNPASAAAPARNEETTQKPAAASLKTFVVTGSRIPRSEKEGATPVTVITGQEIESKGYRNVFDALQSQTQNTGFTQGADFGNTFTPAANALSLRSLGPNHTLVLVDGRRVADYPIAYDGNVNFVNLANIPSAMIDRIEILNGAASAVYGSDAIAGVVNIIMKKHIDGIEVNVKGGRTWDGGGGNGRLQVSGGKEFGALSTVFGLEISKTNPIWSGQRDFMSASTLEGETPTKTWARQNLDTGRYVGAAGACGALAGIGAFGGTSTVNTRNGAYCGSGGAQPSYWTTQTNNVSENLYGGVEYRLSDLVTLFGSVSTAWNQTENNTRGPSWTSAAATTGYFFNQETGANEAWTKRISPQEIGGASVWNKRWDDVAGNLITGLRGKLPDSSWNYELTYSASGYQSRATAPRLFSNVDRYYLGPQLGTAADGAPIYAPSAARFATPLTPNQFASMYGESTSRNNTWTQTFSLAANGNLFSLPAGPVRAASVIEYGTQGFSNAIDPALNQGVYYNSAGATGASGNRKRYAAALELRIPILSQLTANVATRYDDYSFAGTRNNKLTYDLGLEYRPLRELLLRGNYGTSFRAPDMNYIFMSQSKGYFESTTDYFRCNQSGKSLASCEYANVSPGSNFIQKGNANLKPENGKSWGAGFVLAPTPDIDLSADYYNIRIDNLVTTIDPDNLLRTESACRTGQLSASSPNCVDALSRVIRNPLTAVLDPGAINTILVNPINAAMEKTTGFDLGGKWRVRAGRAGTFLLSANFTKVLSHQYQQYTNGPVQDLLHSLANPTGNPEWPDKLTMSLTWSIPKWTSTIQVERYGKVPNAAQTAYLTPTTLANLSLSHQFSRDTSLTFVMNNVFNTIKHDDSAGWPYYTVGYYMPYGRTLWLEFSHRFS